MEMTQISDLALSDSVLYCPICLFIFFSTFILSDLNMPLSVEKYVEIQITIQ